MSLINDALKRARQAQTKQSPPPLASAPLHPAPENRPSTWLALLLPVALVAGAAAAVVLFWKWNLRERTPVDTLAHSETAVLSQPTMRLARADAKRATAQVAATEPARVLSATADEPVRRAAASSATERQNPVPASSAEVPIVARAALPAADANSFQAASRSVADPIESPPARPAFRLQGILYRPANPSAVINDKVVSAGDHIGEARVQTITQQSATLIVDSQAIVLTLP